MQLCQPWFNWNPRKDQISLLFFDLALFLGNLSFNKENDIKNEVELTCVSYGFHFVDVILVNDVIKYCVQFIQHSNDLKRIIPVGSYNKPTLFIKLGFDFT